MNSKLLKFGKSIILANLNLLRNPYKLNFAVTYKCNLKCKICDIWRKQSENELSLEEVDEFAKKNNFFSWVSLTGGEPFLRRDIVEIANIFNLNCKNFYLLNIPTNGFSADLISERVLQILKCGIPKVVIAVGLDGPEKIHNEIRGSQYSWGRAIDTFSKLKRLAEGNRRLRVLFAVTLSPFNVGKFEETYLAVKELVDDVIPSDFHINIFHFSEHFYSNVGNVEIPSEYMDKLIVELEKIDQMKKGGNKLDVVRYVEQKYLRLAKDFVKTGKTPLKCRAISDSVFLDPLGNVYPCTMFNKYLGNIREFDYELKKILALESTELTIEEINEKKCPHCWTPCEANQMIMSHLLWQ